MRRIFLIRHDQVKSLSLYFPQRAPMKIPLLVMLILIAMLIGLSLIFGVVIPS
ncbi:hypothetical protein EDC30_102377 [Paucimonas lemoignei]|uniref:Uncharacterized protein n=1 Tax=Paucimonas lemoignei TaxID=29443 RepID=A0A4R3HZG3_PAULE|nr:hypothetical protein EDC30_102377 [Paucimonas lemoignei]